MSIQGLPHVDLCSICGKILFFKVLSREGNRCKNCGSYWRTRSVIDAISLKYRFDKRVAFKNINPDFSLKTLGMTDSTSITTTMPTKFMHVNSFYNDFPKVDLLNLSKELHECFDLVICSDVFEHIPNNIEKAFMNLYTLIKMNGLLVFSVPLVKVSDKTYDIDLDPKRSELNKIHKEYYPGLTNWDHNVSNNSIRWEDSNSEIHINNEPEFHGGDGLTLTFRLFSKDSIESFLRSVGFRGIELFVNPVSKRNIPDGAIFTAWK
jgi:SAM-dependent methyltransferase